MKTEARGGRVGAVLSRVGKVGRLLAGFMSKCPWERQPPEGSPTSHSQSALKELICLRFFIFWNNFVFGHHDLHSPARLCELGNNKSLNHTTVLQLTA